MPVAKRLQIFRTEEAAALAGDLFRDRFNSPFPVPHDGGLAIPTPPADWRQYVAVYRWPGGREETVGFCNYIKHGDVYLEGGLCVREAFYRRLPREEFRDIRERGGVAQMMMAHAARELTDCKAWFGHCGDVKAMAAGLRSGYERTHQPHIIVKWFADLPAAERRRLIDSIAAIGAF
jgi:hypothetical protein